MPSDDREDRVGVRRAENADGNPGCSGNRRIELTSRTCAVGGHQLARDRLAIDHELDGNVARIPDAGALDVQYGLLVRGAIAQPHVRDRVEQRSDLNRHVRRAGRGGIVTSPLPLPTATPFTVKSIRWLLPVRHVASGQPHGVDPLR